MWQISFAPKKTQAMVISRSPDASQRVARQLYFGGKSLPLQNHVKVLGVSVDRGLRFDHHIAPIANQASLRVSAQRRVAPSLDSRGILTLYKAQIRPCLEYGALSWMSGAATHMQKLDAVQRRALRLVATEDDQQPPSPVTSLDHRRDVSQLVVCHKAQVQGVPHLIPLRPSPRAVQRHTRTALCSDEMVEIPRSHSRQHSAHSQPGHHGCGTCSRQPRPWYRTCPHAKSSWLPTGGGKPSRLCWCFTHRYS